MTEKFKRIFSDEEFKERVWLRAGDPDVLIDELQRAYAHIDELEDDLDTAEQRYFEPTEKLIATEIRIKQLEALKAKADALFKKMDSFEFATLWTGQVREYIKAAKELSDE